MSKSLKLLMSVLMVSLVITGCNKEVNEEGSLGGVDVAGVELTEEGFNVEDAVFTTKANEEQKIETVTGFDMSAAVELVKETLEGMTIEEAYEDMLENVSMSGYFDFDAVRILTGSSENGDTITVTLKQYARFDKATYLSVIYNESEENEKRAVKLVETFYGKEIKEEVISKDEISIESESESGEYYFLLFKSKISVDDEDKTNLVTITLDYGPVFVRQNSIDDYKVFEETKPLYREMKLFEGVALKDIPNKIGDVWGNYKYGVITYNYNTYGKIDGAESRSMVLGSAIIHNNDTQTAVDIVVNMDGEESNYDIIGATPYRETELEAVEDAEKVLSALLETKIEFEADKVYTVKQFGRDYKFKVDMYSKTSGEKFFVSFEAYNVEE